MPREKSIAAPAEDRWISEVEASQLLGLSRSWFQHGRWKGTTPIPFYKLSRTIRYKLSECIAFAESRKQGVNRAIGEAP